MLLELRVDYKIGLTGRIDNLLFELTKVHSIVVVLEEFGHKQIDVFPVPVFLLDHVTCLEVRLVAVVLADAMFRPLDPDRDVTQEQAHIVLLDDSCLINIVDSESYEYSLFKAAKDYVEHEG